MTNRQMDKKQTNKQTELHQFRNLAMMVIYIPVKFEFNWTNCFRDRVWKRKCGRTNRQKNGQTKEQNYTNFERNLAMMVIGKTDIGHINLIGGWLHATRLKILQY